MTKPLAGKIALVTGASGGLGELDDEIKKAGGGATLVPADMRDFAAFDRLGASLAERYGRLDVLVGNAGQLGTLTPLPHIEPKEWDEVMAVNVTANWRLIRSLDPLLGAAEAGGGGVGQSKMS